jgi:hypothetical protein
MKTRAVCASYKNTNSLTNGICLTFDGSGVLAWGNQTWVIFWHLGFHSRCDILALLVLTSGISSLLSQLKDQAGDPAKHGTSHVHIVSLWCEMVQGRASATIISVPSRSPESARKVVAKSRVLTPMPGLSLRGRFAFFSPPWQLPTLGVRVRRKVMVIVQTSVEVRSGVLHERHLLLIDGCPFALAW